MPLHTHDPQGIVKFFTSAVSAFLLVSVFFVLQYIFDIDFECSCQPGVHPITVLFIVLPPVVLVWLVNIIKPSHKREISFLGCSKFQNVYCDCVWKGIRNYICLGVVWFTAVLFDGDWYVCLKTNLNANQTGLPCRNNLTYEEELIKAAYKTDSLNYGLFAICSLAVVWTLAKWIHFCCVRIKKCCDFCPSCLKPRPFYKVVYEDLLEEQVRKRLKDQLLEIAKEKAKHICESHLQEIRTHELDPDHSHEENDGDETVSDTWWNISASDFHSPNLRPYRNFWSRGWTAVRGFFSR